MKFQRLAPLQRTASEWLSRIAPYRDRAMKAASQMAPFTLSQRAATVAGLAPAFLMGCAVHEGARTAMLVPPAMATEVTRAAAIKPNAPAPRPNAPAPRALVAQIDSLVANFKGTVGVAVTSVDMGWIASANGDLKLPQQSVSKLWVAMTVLDAVDRGTVKLDDPLTITEADFTLFHQPVASLVRDGVGYTSTVGEIMRRALTMSDNTCNDKLLRLVGGPDAVRRFIAGNALGSIRFGPGEIGLQSATAGVTWRPEYSRGNAFAVARAALPPATRLAAFEAYVSDPPDGAAPAAIAGALARLQRGELLSPGSTQWLIDTMRSSHTGRQRLRGAVPPDWLFGHKTGTGQDYRGRTAGYNDVGILVAPDGKAYALAVMIGDTGRPIKERQELMQAVVAAIVANHG